MSKRLSSKQTKAKRKKLISKFGKRCFWCHCKLSENQLTIDHIIPISKGGSNNLENLLPACFPCNNNRGNKLSPPPRILKTCFIK